MLCRRYDGGCFAAPISLGPADTLPPLLLLLWRMLCRRVCAADWSSLVDASRAVELLILVDAWPPIGCFRGQLAASVMLFFM